MIDTRGFSSFVRLGVLLRVPPPPLDSKTGWTRELWLKTNLLKWQNKYLFQQKINIFNIFRVFEEKNGCLLYFFSLQIFEFFKLFFLTIFLIFGFFMFFFLQICMELLYFTLIFRDFYFWISHSKHLKLQLKLTEVTTEHPKLPKIS